MDHAIRRNDGSEVQQVPERVSMIHGGPKLMDNLASINVHLMVICALTISKEKSIYLK